ncbi:serine/threonine-protein kinase [Chitinivorax sp. B]|uniref:serine/threonine protein kinase n=1 Tax=Chitinivorax sp. B TaxID=2502235 RepID=UPI0010F92C24|nr:serine/threonine-protein kinase [Chitinivorax sp. B]
MANQSNRPLPRGYQLLNYTIVKQLSAGGFSLVYLAHDENDRPVAIKEYLPSSLVLRTDGDKIVATDPDKLATFRFGLKCFFEEGKTLAHIQHPNVVRVLNFFRANETVYMVMEYERGRTLQREIQLHQSVREDIIRHVFYHMLNGLREVHLNKLLHLDIKPANIYIRRDGSPVLLDFGSARQTLSNEVKRFTPMYTPGFAAPEQYKNRENLGPWTDIYAVGASIFACMAGFAPQAADSRVEEDKLVSAKKLWKGKYSDELLDIVDWCLHLNHLDRPQSVHALQKALSFKPQQHQEPPKAGILNNLKMTLARIRKT